MNGQNLPKKTIVGKIDSVISKKTGVSATGRPWEIFEVLINGQKFSTFTNTFQTLVGQTGTWQYTEKQSEGRDGQVYINKTLLSPDVKKPAQSSQNVQWIKDEFMKIHEKLDLISSLVRKETSYEGDPNEDMEDTKENISIE